MYNEQIDRLRDIHQQMMELAQEADRIVSETNVASGFTAYVTNNIKCALGNEWEEFPTMNETLYKTITALETEEAYFVDDDD